LLCERRADVFERLPFRFDAEGIRYAVLERSGSISIIKDEQ
jgi:uncharacterized membrane protein YcaP (DUF421 family)